MNHLGPQRILHDPSSATGLHREPGVKEPILSKRVCFYKSGDPQFNGLRMVINNRTFKTFDALLDSLSKKVPLPFGVRNITTPQGVHAIYSLDELEDGKSYICSDTRKVKPINLSKARKKLPPWYHARPVSARRQTVQQIRQFPGRSIQRHELVVLRTPKKLVVFRNGEPTVRHTVVLHKRSSPTFNSILDHISELMQFRVVKLHTPDGRRVDGLPGLIMCSGTVVASGREPFKPANYGAEKSPAPTRVSNKRNGPKKLKSLNRRKKTLSHSSQSRIFSPSSESYMVNRIHNSIAEGSVDHHLHTDPTNSVDFESSHMLESLPGTEVDACLRDGAEGQDCALPSEDDIEKSFRVNQDGSMTVEMRVRLTVKEEEMVQWTTTLSRSNVANQVNDGCLPEPEAEQEVCSDFPTPEPYDDNQDQDGTDLNNHEDPPYLSNEGFCENLNEVEHTEVPQHTSTTAGYKQIRQQEASVETIETVTPEGIQEGVLGSYSYKEHIENGDMTEQYCMVKQRTKRPVPKPRRLGSLDATNLQSSFKAAGMTQVLQVESSGEEVTETVLHIYEQQTCHDNFLANVCAEDRSTIRSNFGAASSETGTDDFALEHCGHLSSSKLIRKTDHVQSETTVSPTTSRIQTGSVAKSAKGKGRRPSHKPKQRLSTPVKRKRNNSAEQTSTKGKSFSSAKFIKRIYGNKSKSTKKPKKNLTRKGIVGLSNPSTQPTDGANRSLALEKPNTQLPFADKANRTLPSELSHRRGNPTEPSSAHLGKKNDKTSGDIIQTTPLPDSPSVTDEYVQNWLEKNMMDSSFYPELIHQTPEAPRTKESCGVTAAAEEEESATQPQKGLQLDCETSSVKLKIQRFENKLHSFNTKTVAEQQETSSNQRTTANAECPTSVVHNNTEVKPAFHGICNEMTVETGTVPDVDRSSKASSSSDRNDAPLSRHQSIKKVPLISNQSFERKMSLRKASLHRYTLGSDAESEGTTSSVPITSVNDHSDIRPSLKNTQNSNGIYDLKTDPSCRTPASQSSTTSGLSSISISSSEHSNLDHVPPIKTDTSRKQSQKVMSPKPLVRKEKVKSSPDPKRKPQSEESLSDSTRSFHGHRSEKIISTNGIQHNSTPTQLRRKGVNKDKLAKKASPYSQSMDLASPPVRHRSVRKTLSRSLSSDVSSEPERRTRRKTLSIKHHQKPQTAAVDTTNQLQSKVVFEKIYSSINKINQITQNRCQSRSPPDYPSLVASTFGSPSKTLLAFLSIMSLKEGLTNFDAKKWNAAHVSCSEASQLIDSLREIASMEDSQKMKSSLSNLQQSASEQLLQSWKDFQKVCDNYDCSNSLSGDERTEGGPDKDSFVNQVISDLDLPEKLKKELASLSGANLHVRSFSLRAGTKPTKQGTNREENQSEARSPPSRSEKKRNLSMSNCNKASSTTEHHSETEIEHYVELNIPGKPSSSRKDQPVEPCSEVSADPENSEAEPKSHKPIKGLHDGANGGSGNSDEDQSEVEEGEDGAEGEGGAEECLSETKIEEERISSPEQEDMEVKSGKLKALIEGFEEDDEPYDDESKTSDTGGLQTVDGGLCRLTGDQDQLRTSSEREELNKHGYTTAGGTEHQEAPVSEAQCEVTICEDDVTEAKEDSVKGISQSVAERISLLEKHVAESEKRKNVPETPATQHLSQRCNMESDAENLSSESPSSQSGLCTRSAPQSSLSFSYDSSGVITTEPEGRVRSIREMFLAKGATDVQHGSKGFSSSNSTETLGSDGYQSQTSAKLSGSEDDPARNFITKGFVRRTIERLYGRKDQDEVGERPSSAPKQKPNSSIFPSFKTARSRKVSELTYFYSTNALDTLTEATRCIAFNAQVEPEDHIDNGQWLLRENTPIRKSFSDPAGIYTTFSHSPQVDGPDEGTNGNPRPQDKENPISKKCTYFSLPHAIDSDLGQDDQNVVDNSIRDATENSPDSKVKAERNGMLPGSGVTDFKMKDNKVHPMVKVPPDGEVVVVQPGKGQGAVSRRLQEPDVLDFLYNFCGEHCPIL